MRSLGRMVRGLEVRPRLVILHNLFFLILGSCLYFLLIPGFERQAATARDRENRLLTELFAAGWEVEGLSGLRSYQLREGPASALGVPENARRWLDEHADGMWRDPAQPAFLYRRGPAPDTYRRLELPAAYYENIVRRAKRELFLALAVVYVFSVLGLELLILPRYVYRPLARLSEVEESLRHKTELVAKLREELANQDRLASLGLMTAGVAHELNTPVAVLRGSIESLLEKCRDESAKEKLVRMLRVTGRLEGISAGLLRFSKPAAMRSERVALRSVIDEAWKMVSLDPRSAALRFVNQASPKDTVRGDEGRLAQVFVNLFRNAGNAIQSGGSIAVQSRRGVAHGQEWISVTVEDNGPGIPEEILPHVFRAFVTGQRDERGTGLGLSVAEGIVLEHGGTIQASNRPQGGACFEIRFPAARMEVTV